MRFSMFAFLAASALAGPPHDPILQPLVGPSRHDGAVNYHRLHIVNAEDAYRVRFRHVLYSTEVTGRLERAARFELEKLAQQVELVPVGPVDYYLLNPASVYYWVRFEPGNAESAEVNEVAGRIVSRRYVPEAVVLEVVPIHGTTMVQLHFLQRKHPEVLKTMIFSGLHMTTERRLAEREGCGFDMSWD